jgi:hypothetical protein
MCKSDISSTLTMKAETVAETLSYAILTRLFVLKGIVSAEHVEHCNWLNYYGNIYPSNFTYEQYKFVKVIVVYYRHVSRV